MFNPTVKPTKPTKTRKAKATGGPRQRKRPGVKTPAIVFVPSINSVAVAAGKTVSEALEAVIDTVESSDLVEVKTEDKDGKPVPKTRRKARLIEGRKLQRNTITVDVDELKELTLDDFAETLIDAKTVIF